MQAPEMLAYVKASAVVLGLALDDAQALRVAAHLARTAALADQLAAYPLGPEDEPAEIYRPSAFPLPAEEDPKP